MKGNKELILNLRAILNKIDDLTLTCLRISEYDHIKVDLAKRRNPMEHEQLCDAVMKVRNGLELRARIKNEIDRIYCDMFKIIGRSKRGHLFFYGKNHSTESRDNFKWW